MDTTNTWTEQLEDILLSELKEVFQVNLIAPFILNTALKALMEKNNSQNVPRFIVNVSAMEGVFYRQNKNSTHAHTNMAKAALNMMTRTAGSHYATSNIYMTSADTGWVTDENPFLLHLNKFVCPLDEVDGAMRVLDPIYEGLKGNKLEHSVFLKDYKVGLW
jgi:NAD(P)-dependent dehydrogenase (short-subunit alcohol dehydrogenase family)